MIRDVGVQRTVGERGLLLEAELLHKANLGQTIQVIIENREIRLLPVEKQEDWQKVLDELAGCLGTERAEDYDFDLKVRNPYGT